MAFNRLHKRVGVVIQWPLQSRNFAKLYMGLSNDHELAIARIVDQLSISDRLDTSVIDGIMAAIGFTPSRADIEFLVHYIRWRIENPVVK